MRLIKIITYNGQGFVAGVELVPIAIGIRPPKSKPGYALPMFASTSCPPGNYRNTKPFVVRFVLWIELLNCRNYQLDALIGLSVPFYTACKKISPKLNLQYEKS